MKSCISSLGWELALTAALPRLSRYLAAGRDNMKANPPHSIGKIKLHHSIDWQISRLTPTCSLGR
jgi:hypothetical protein